MPTTSTLERAPAIPPPPAAAAPSTVGSRLRRAARGTAGLATRPSTDPRWARPALLGLLLTTAALYLWQLTATGYGNSFYAAAVQAGSKSWKALLFGSLDAGNAITVDKPPASLWVMGLSARLFGFSSWSLLMPQAVIGVATVGLLYATVRRQFGPAAGLLAGAAFAATPVAALMFRYDQPDALLVLLLVAGAYATLRAVEQASPRWLALAGTALGFAFLTKMLQAFLVLPAIAVVYLIAAPTRRRLLHLLGAATALLVSAGWFVALVALWPTASRPYIGGSTNDSLLELALDYNGIGRLSGSDGPGLGGNSSLAFGGTSGIGRLFGASMGTEISWLLPAAVIALGAGLWFLRGTPRTDPGRAALLLWGGWLLVSGGVLSFMTGIVHPYYTVALAPAVAALVGIGAHELWRGRDSLAARISLALMVGSTGIWSFALLGRTPDWLPWLRWTVLIGSALAAAALLLRREQLGRAARPLAVAAFVLAFAGTGAFTLATAASAHSGSLPASGPTAATAAATAGPGGSGGGNTSDLAVLLRSTDEKWAAATTGATSAADLELASGKAVIAVGGWSGGDPSPTLAEFQRYVATGQVHYYISGGQGGQRGNGSIASWVQANFASSTVGGSTVYDLTRSTAN